MAPWGCHWKSLQSHNSESAQCRDHYKDSVTVAHRPHLYFVLASDKKETILSLTMLDGTASFLLTFHCVVTALFL